MVEECLAWKQAALQALLQQNLVNEADPLCLMWNLDECSRAMRTVRAAFPPHFVHTMAVKCNPYIKTMELVRDEGLGFECASLGELLQALQTGVSADLVVFDSPVKTKHEMQTALTKGVALNVDNFEELAVLEAVRAELGCKPEWKLGIRCRD